MYDVTIYIEITIKGIARQDGEWGAVAECLDKNGEPRTVEEYGSIKNTTSNQLILQAMYSMLKKIRWGCNVTINMDNQWVVNMITQKTYQKWKENDWKKANGEQVSNMEEWIALEGILNDYNISFADIREHSYKNYIAREISARKESVWKNQG